MADRRPETHQPGPVVPKRTEGVFLSLIVVAAVVTLTLSAWAWTLQLEPYLSGNSASAWVRVGLNSLQALSLSDFPKHGDVTPETAQLLSYAYISGAVFVILVGRRLVLFALADWFTELQLARRRNHDLVIGNGPAARGYPAISGRECIHIAEGFQTSGGSKAYLGRTGDLDRQLRQGSARRAHQIIVDEGEDAATWETAQQIASRLKNEDVTVSAFISDAWTEVQLTRSSIDMKLRPFSYASGVARQVMLAHPPYLLARCFNAPAQHILVIGFGSVGQSLLREFMATSVSYNPAPLMVTAIDSKDMGVREHELRNRIPALHNYVDLQCLAGDLRIPSQDIKNVLMQRHVRAPICAVYIAIDIRNQALGFSYLVRDFSEEMGILAPIFVCAQRGAGFEPAHQGVGILSQQLEHLPSAAGQRGPVPGPVESSKLSIRRLCSFGSWTDAMDGAGLLELPAPDEMAKRFHENYLKGVGSEKKLDKPSHQSWARLPDEFRVSNRRAVVHIRAKLDAIGFNLNEWLEAADGRRACHEFPDLDSKLDEKNKELVERLAELEHRRWLIDRALMGLRFGKKEDGGIRTHEGMIGWNDLVEGERDKSRSSVGLVFDLVYRTADRGRAKAKSGKRAHALKGKTARTR